MRRFWIGALGAAVTLASAGVTSADAHQPTNAPGVDACDWASFRNSAANTGRSACTGIGVGNVSTLHPQLLYRTRDSVTSTPAVVDGVLYVGAWDGRFYAFDTTQRGVGDPSLPELPVETMQPKWTFDIDDDNGVAFGRIVSSPAVVDIGLTRVVIFAGGATVYVLDAATGAKLAWLCLDPRSDADAADDGGRCSGSSADIEIESSPTVVPMPDGSVSIVIGHDTHNRPRVGRTGVVHMRLTNDDGWSLTPLWKFDPEARVAYTAAGQGTAFLSHGSGTGDGCGGVWGTPAVDVARDVVILGTSSCGLNAADPDDVAGEKLFGVRLSTGAELWRYSPPRPWGSQVDDDFGASPQLFTVGTDLVAGAGSKDGWYYARDALTGAFRWAKQIGQAGHLSEGFAVGGILGSPALGVARGRPTLFITTAISTPFAAPPDRGSFESLDLSLADDPARLLSIHAVDAATGKLVWRSPLTRQTYGHPTYANGVVFVPSTVGLAIEAFEANTGVPLWRSVPLNGAPSSGVAVTDAGIFVGAGTRQTDLGFKIEGDDSNVPEPIQALIRQTPAADLIGADPQERLSGVWAFRPVR